jgi:glycosyltransferase involved in cell wall biosynthesis
MRIGFVVQRYGDEIAGGAEAACRALAIRLAARGHHVEVLTSCAVSYVDWANVLPAGTSIEHDVTVHRLPVTNGRQLERFAALSERTLNGRYPPTWELQREWFLAQGPDIDAERWLIDNCDRFDVMVFFTYLYWPTVRGVPAIAGRVPIVIHPTAHDEPPLRLSAIRPALRAADALVFLTPEEEQLVRGRLHLRQRGEVIGIGVEPFVRPSDDEIAAVGQQYGLGDGYETGGWLLCLGRVDPSKGTPELVQWYGQFRRRRVDRSLLTPPLVLAGDPAHRLDVGDGVHMVGIVDDATKAALIAGASVLVHPSYFESFSMVVTEAWSAGVPALVQGRCEVLAGQAARSGGGFAYRGFAEFDAALGLLLADPELRRSLGEAGVLFTTTTLSWERLLDRYVELLASVARGSER